VHTNQTENIQRYLEKKDNNQKAIDTLRSFRVRRLHDQKNAKFGVSRTGGLVKVEDNDVNLGIQLKELPPVRMDINEIHDQNNKHPTSTKGM